ncbi:MAG: type II toxin-antitoxin system HipA family toxin [Verrucomicrobiae bacterium]|nr:type II toxin-antitoxin system HipA family toxin [Verrucomicrobiae bacterium]
MRLTVKYHDQIVGQLREYDQRILFSYDQGWITRGLELSPIQMPGRAGIFENLNSEMLNLPGLFFDSLPDAWGLHVMRKHFAQQGIPESSLTPLTLLAYLHTRPMGALTYHLEDVMTREKPLKKQLDLAILTAEAENVLSNVEAHLSAQFDRISTSAGGARPKILVAIRGGEMAPGCGVIPEGFDAWLIKLAAAIPQGVQVEWSPSDLHRMEYGYSLMAKAAGIPMPPTRLIMDSKGRAHFAVRRFDRQTGEGENQKIHLQSFAGLSHSLKHSDYSGLFRATARLTRDYQQICDLFKRAAFNVAAINCDDHARNFSFLMDDKGNWTLSPAYDLTFSPCGNPKFHSMTMNGNIEPKLENLIRLAGAHSLEKKHVREILDHVKSAVNRWPEFAGEASLSQANTHLVQNAIRDHGMPALMGATGRAAQVNIPLPPPPPILGESAERSPEHRAGPAFKSSDPLPGLGWR